MPDTSVVKRYEKVLDTLVAERCEKVLDTLVHLGGRKMRKMPDTFVVKRCLTPR
jgi:hypothetical protein